MSVNINKYDEIFKTIKFLEYRAVTSKSYSEFECWISICNAFEHYYEIEDWRLDSAPPDREEKQ